MKVFLYLVNILAFLLFGIDKLLAIYHKRRIPERVLLVFGLSFACFGSFLGMLLFHHKIRKKKFLFLISFAVLFWIMVFFRLGEFL